MSGTHVTPIQDTDNDSKRYSYQVHYPDKPGSSWGVRSRWYRINLILLSVGVLFLIVMTVVFVVLYAMARVKAAKFHANNTGFGDGRDGTDGSGRSPHGSPFVAGESYIDRRNRLIHEESNQMIGHDLVLTQDEQRVSDILMQHKNDLYNRSLAGAITFPPDINFMKMKAEIDKSPIYKIIKDMPKGAVLHLHDICTVHHDWLLNVTYQDNCYIGEHKEKGDIFFRFSNDKPTTAQPYANESNDEDEKITWTLLKEKRANVKDVKAFDDSLRKHMVMPVDTISNQDKLWDNFIATLTTVGGLILYEGVFGSYHYQAMVEARRDNVQYLEIRAQLNNIYRLDGTLLSREEALLIYKNTTERFVQDYPDFSGVKIIHEEIRLLPEAEMLESIKEGARLYTKYPDFMIGYDLVAQEDRGFSLLHYLNELQYPSEHMGIDLPFYFHAGETDWQGTHVDENLFDAIQLNTTRIGHGYALAKHPLLLEIVKERNIPIEVSPISNQVLGLVQDLRNHPMVSLIAQGYPIVICSDDPATWHADLLSHDFYMAFVALSGKRSDLSLLKKLAINSIQFSGMSQSEKSAAMALHTNKWDTFIKKTIDSHNNTSME